MNYFFTIEDFNFKVGDGECLNEVKDRMLKGLDLILEQDFNNVLVVGHGTAIASLLSNWCEINYGGEYKFNGNNEDFDQILEEVSKQFKEKLTKEELKKSMNKLANLENIFIIRLVPIFIKDIVLKWFHYDSNRNKTMSLSNIGIIKVPEELEKHINLFGVFISTDSISSCMCSYKDKMVITFTSHFIDHEIQKNFVRYLTNKGIEITVNTNIIGEEEYDEKVF